MREVFIRFLFGGLFVSAFAVRGDSLKPKNLFGAAPSLAVATLALTIHSQGAMFAAAEAHSMLFGAIAFLIFAITVCQLTMSYKLRASFAAMASVAVWLIVTFGLAFAIG